MRIRAFVVLTALLLAPAAGATRQETPNARPSRSVGSVDFGGQFSTINGDEARYQRYKDLRSGGLLDAFKYTREKENWLFDVTANHVGYRDQKFVAQFRHYERATDLLHVGSDSALLRRARLRRSFGLLSATPYRRVGDGEYRINDAVQTTLQAFCPTPPCATSTLTSKPAGRARAAGESGGADARYPAPPRRRRSSTRRSP